MGYWTITLDEGNFAWQYSDIFERGTYACAGNALQIAVGQKTSVAEYDPIQKTLAWENVIYRQIQ